MVAALQRWQRFNVKAPYIKSNVLMVSELVLLVCGVSLVRLLISPGG